MFTTSAVFTHNVHIALYTEIFNDSVLKCFGQYWANILWILDKYLLQCSQCQPGGYWAVLRPARCTRPPHPPCIQWLTAWPMIIKYFDQWLSNINKYQICWSKYHCLWPNIVKYFDQISSNIWPNIIKYFEWSNV